MNFNFNFIISFLLILSSIELCILNEWNTLKKFLSTVEFSLRFLHFHSKALLLLLLFIYLFFLFNFFLGGGDYSARPGPIKKICIFANAA